MENFPPPFRLLRSTAATNWFRVLSIWVWVAIPATAGDLSLQVGSAVVDVTPTKLPISITGSIAVKFDDRVLDPLAARSLSVTDGRRSVAICIVDNCTLPQTMVDSAIRRVCEQTDLPPSGIVIAATHTHSAPAVMDLHGNDRDDDYAAQLEDGIVQSLIAAASARRDAEVGHATVDFPKWTFVRRWLMRDGTAAGYPFTGRASNRVQFNPGHQNPDKIRPVGVPDPRLSVLAFRDRGGKPIAALVNYNTHYAGAPHLSSDYFGVVCRGLGKAIGSGDDFVALASNGNSGNINCIDFSQSQPTPFTHKTVGQDCIEAAVGAYRSIQTFRSDVPVDSVRGEVDLAIRKPEAAEVARAAAATSDWIDQRGPQNWVESYARETVKLADYPDRLRLPLRSLRIGDFAIGTIPCEVYAETGIGIKSRSPFDSTIVVGWAGGYWGYLPTPEAFRLGGYTTWRCRSSLLEETAEPKIAAAIDDQLLELSRRRLPLPVAEVAKTFGEVAKTSPVSTIQTADGLAVELVAREPQIIDPVAARSDE